MGAAKKRTANTAADPNQYDMDAGRAQVMPDRQTFKRFSEAT